MNPTILLLFVVAGYLRYSEANAIFDNVRDDRRVLRPGKSEK